MGQFQDRLFQPLTHPSARVYSLAGPETFPSRFRCMLSLRLEPSQGRNSRQGTNRVLLSIAPKPSRNSRPISPLIDYVGIALKSAS